MEDIKLRDLSRIHDSELTNEERRELRRRYEEFVRLLRKDDGLSNPKSLGARP